MVALVLAAGCGRLRFEAVDGDALGDVAPDPFAQRAYLKASNPRALGFFGLGMAMSADGSTIAVGSAGDASAATGINGDQTDASAINAGAAYVFTRSGGAWVQQAYIKASNTDADDLFGINVALSADGSTLAVGAYLEDSIATGVGGNEGDNSAMDAGAVYVFTRVGTTWSQQAYIKASNTDANDRFGDRVALSADGSTLVVGAYLEDSAATGIGGNEADNSALEAGAAYVFTRTGTTWSQQAYLKASNTDAQDLFSYSLALSGDGSTLAVGALQESSGSTGIGGNQTDDGAMNAGAVYVFTRAGATWSQDAYVKASNTDQADQFGIYVALSADTSTLAVGAYSEDSNARGIGGDEANNAALSAGAVYVFTRGAGPWQQQAYIKASNTDPTDLFGTSVALSGDGSTLAVGAIFEASAAVGIDGNQDDNSAPQSGAVYMFTRSGTSWRQDAYVKASNPDADDELGLRVALSQSGSTLAVCAYHESSASSNEADNTAMYAGAVYVFE